MDSTIQLKKVTSNEIGQNAELLALQFLQSRGLKLIEKNFSSRHGEIDLIMSDKEGLVFVEVRFRKNTLFGTGAETVDW